ncbi:VOC family protein [Tumebacillus sp. ITR2]|uniref:VOC family protein n=1 Tax=Tumebacillus amylolyticus TaxID=2801339 RepID=A0ABS1J4S2_9BACL|nr:VOC family protein [Tumebacillus amylolyticus]MBL0385185.1 VOC family protein [Tumebacillus amylolyticus]
MKLVPYLTFGGAAEEAMNFYADVVQGEIIQLDRYNSAPGMQIPEGFEEKVLHGRVKFGDNFLYFSDTDRPIASGDSVSLAIEFSSDEQINHAFEKLSQGGNVQIALAQMFWGGKYAKLTDKFGTHWDLNHFNKTE